MSEVNYFNDKRSRAADYKKKQEGKKKSKIKEARNNGGGKDTIKELEKALKNISPEGGNFGFDSELLMSAFGTRNIVFFTSFISGLGTSTSWANTMSLITMYLSKVLDETMIDELMDQVNAFKVTKIEPEGGFSDIWKSAKSVAGIFKRFKNTTLFKRLRDLLTLCVVVGVIDKKCSKMTSVALNTFSIKSSTKLDNIGDIFDLISKTIVYFAESGYRLFTTRSTDFLFEADDLMAQYQKVVEYWPVCKTGNLIRVYGMDPRQFGTMLEECRKAINLATNESSGPEKALYMRMGTHLGLIRAEYLQCKTNGKLRQAPIVIMIAGDSSVGKTTISKMVANVCLKSLGLPYDEDRVRTWNPTDAFDSWADGQTLCLMADDMAVMVEYDKDGSPSVFLVRIGNNAPCTATKADVDEKGKIPIDVAVVVCTINVMSALMSNVSCETAIKRRMDVVLRPFVKPSFRNMAGVNSLSSSKVIAEYGTMSGINNVWDFQVIEPEIISVSTTRGNMDYEKQLHSFEEADLDKNTTTARFTLKMVGNTIETMNYLVEKCVHHKLVQEYVVESNTTLASSITVCLECKKVSEACVCNIEPEVGMLYDWSNIVQVYHKNPVYDFACKLPRMAIGSNYVGWMCDIVFARRLFEFHMRQKWYYCFYWCYVFSCLLKFWSVWMNPLSIFVGLAFLAQALLVFAQIVRTVRDRAYDQILASPIECRSILGVVRDYRVQCAGAICVAAVSIFQIYKMYRKYMVISSESALHPTSMEEVEERMQEENPWAAVKVDPPPVSGKAENMTHDQVVNTVAKNLVHVSWGIDGIRSFCNGLFIKSNYIVLPNHMKLENPELVLHFQRRDENVINSGFDSYIDYANSVRIADSDLRIYQVHSAPSFADIVHLFPDANDKSRRVVTEIFRDLDGSLRKDGYAVCGKMVTNNAEGIGKPVFFGSHHRTKLQTFDGHCGAVLVTNCRIPYIHGFHIGGDKQYDAVSCQATKKALLQAFGGMSRILPEASAGTMCTILCGVNILTSTSVHPKCATNYLPRFENNKVTVFGTTIGRATPKSDVRKTIISDVVKEEMGVPNMWGPPPFNSVRDHSVALQCVANNSFGFRVDHLYWAADDFVMPLIQAFKRLGLDIRVFNHREVMDGIPGRRFANAFNKNSAIGAPRSGNKLKYMTKVKDESLPHSYDFDDITMQEVDRMCECYRRGERAYPLAKTSLKDEPTKLTKEKSRIFYVSNSATLYLVRKYFLSICAAYSTFPLLSGCAVGINRQGPEWEELINYIRKFGHDRVLAGDHKHFDLDVPVQMVRIAFYVHLEIAKAFGFDEDALCIMRGLAADLCEPLLAFNGTLLMLSGLHLSGSPLTVYNGCIINNIYLRLFFRSVTDGTKPFRDYCACTTYGDDLDGTVSPEIPQFNNIGFRDFLAKHGLTYTAPDKSSDMVPYMKSENVDFLKCKSRFDPEFGHTIALLDENSIFKSLHSARVSKALSREEAAGINVDGALREWLFHGRELYELRRSQLNRVVDNAGLRDFTTGLEEDFDYKLGKWKEKYFPSNNITPEGGCFVSALPPFMPRDDENGVCHHVNCSIGIFWWESVYLVYMNLIVLSLLLLLVITGHLRLLYKKLSFRFIVFIYLICGSEKFLADFIIFVFLPILIEFINYM